MQVTSRHNLNSFVLSSPALELQWPLFTFPCLANVLGEAMAREKVFNTLFKFVNLIDDQPLIYKVREVFLRK
jgi:hypothetical protein